MTMNVALLDSKEIFLKVLGLGRRVLVNHRKPEA
jgi:hypothetical protein